MITNTTAVPIGSLARDDNGAFKIGPFGSSLKKSELVSEGIPVAGIENVLPNEFVLGFRRFITSEKFTDLSDYEIRGDDVLVTTMGTIGRAAVAPSGLGRAIIDSHLFRMRLDTTRSDPRYVCYAINSNLVVAQLAQKAHGTIMDGLNTSILRECSIPLPGLPEQQRIVKLLHKADRLRRMRQFAMELSGDFLRTVFRQMFGKALASAQMPLGDLVTITGGGTPSRAIPAYYTGNFPWLTSKDMRGDYIWDTEEHITQEAIDKSATKLVPIDSILLVVKSKVLMHRLPLAISRVALCHGQDIKSIQCSDKVLPEVVRYVLDFHTPRLLQIARGANTEGLTLPMLEELPVPDIKIEDQQRFARIVEQAEALRSGQREALRQSKHLFQTLLHQAFSPVKEEVPA